MNKKELGVVDDMYQPPSPPDSSWHITSGLILSIGIHAVLLLQLAQLHLTDVKIPHQTPFVEVELVSMATAREIHQNVEPMPPKPRPENPPKKVQAPKPIPKVKSPTKHKKHKVVKKIATHVQDTQTSKTVVNPVHHTTSPNHAMLQTPSNIDQQQKQLRQQYLSRIIAAIQAHKSYPYSARRRHLEGDIQVSFSIDAQGQISELHISGGSSVLRASTKQAIEDAMPFPPPPQHQTIQSHFIMQYRLK